jgi:hypothetical protein
MKNIIKILILTGLLAQMTSCKKHEFEKEIDWDFKKIPAKMIVEGSITNEVKQQAIQLSLTQAYNDSTKTKGVSGCVVTIKQGSNVYDFFETDTMAGLYISKEAFGAERFKTYDLHIAAPEGSNLPQKVTASATMQDGIDLVDARATIVDDYEEDKETFEILLVYYEGYSKTMSNNYYIINVIEKDDPRDERHYHYLMNEEYVDADSLKSEYLQFWDQYTAGDSVELELRTVDKHYYRFVDAMKQISSSGDLFGFGPTKGNAVGNVNNGDVLGYFSVEYVSRAHLVIDDSRETE